LRLEDMKNLLKWVLGRIAGGWQINRLLKSVVTFMLRTIARKVVIELLANLCAMQIKPFSGHDDMNNKLPGLLVLSPERFGKDLDVLAGTGRFRFLLSPVKWQMGLFSLFYPSGLSNIQMASHQGNPELESCQQAYREFLKIFLAKICHLKRIDCVIGANFWYHQDIHWGSVARSIGVPYVVFFKEGFRTSKRDQKLLVDQCGRLGGHFEGSILAAQNEVIHEILVDCGYVDRQCARSVGIPRMDDFVNSLKDLPSQIDQSDDETVTLFSFSPGIGLLDKGIVPWPKNKDEGWARLFEDVHAAFTEAAVLHPDVKFMIKPKWGGPWIDRIEEVVASTGRNLSDIPNLEISLDENAHTLIRKSRVICCFNSSTMLEASIAKRAVIVPQFEDAISDDLREFFKFYDRDDLFDLAHSRSEMVSLISRRLASYEPDEEILGAREKEFEKWLSGLDGLATEKWCKTIESVIQHQS
jgi:hypothetical protein